MNLWGFDEQTVAPKTRQVRVRRGGCYLEIDPALTPDSAYLSAVTIIPCINNTLMWYVGLYFTLYHLPSMQIIKYILTSISPNWNLKCPFRAVVCSDKLWFMKFELCSQHIAGVDLVYI